MVEALRQIILQTALLAALRQLFFLLPSLIEHEAKADLGCIQKLLVSTANQAKATLCQILSTRRKPLVSCIQKASCIQHEAKATCIQDQM